MYTYCVLAFVAEQSDHTEKISEPIQAEHYIALY
jgi:hypothetical protein